MKKIYTLEQLQEEALKYENKTDFRKNNLSAYTATLNSAHRKSIMAHMPKHDSRKEKHHGFKWTFEKLRERALKHKTRSDFRKSDQAAYLAATRRDDYEEIVSHMPEKDIKGNRNPNFRWPLEKIQKEANKYKHRIEFLIGSPKAYYAATYRLDYEEIVSHMVPLVGSSLAELELLSRIKEIFPKARKKRYGKVIISGKPHICGFEIDILVNGRGIEYDGTYVHSFEGLKSSRCHWPDEDIRNYHDLKDTWFWTSQGIKILHIKEEEWIADKQTCIKRCLDFLSSGD